MGAMASSNDAPASREVGSLVRDVALAVAEGQRDMDRHSLATQRELDAAAATGEAEYELAAPWYKFAEVDVDLSLDVEVDLSEDAETEGGFYRPRIFARPITTRERTRREVDSSLKSDVRFKIVPVPPERR